MQSGNDNHSCEEEFLLSKAKEILLKWFPQYSTKESKPAIRRCVQKLLRR